MKKDTIILQKLRAALKLFLTASQYKSLIDEDFEKLQEFLAEKGLYLSDEGPRPKTSYVSFPEFCDSIAIIGKKYYHDFESKFHVSGKIEFGSNRNRYKLELTIYDTTDGKWKIFFNHDGSFSPKAILVAFEEKLQGLEIVAGMELPVDDVKPKTEE